jgi:hypothetical protein
VRQPNPNTTQSFLQLANLFVQQGKYVEAELFYQRVLSIYEQQLSRSHPRVTVCLNNLALLSQQQRKYAKAELVLRRVLAINGHT